MRQSLRRLWAGVRADIRWAGRVVWHYQKPLWVITLAGLVVSSYFTIAPSMGQEPALRITGMFSQIVGFGIVARGLLDISRVFDQPSLWQQALGHVKKTPRRKQGVSIEVGTATLGIRAEGAVVRAGPSATATIDERLAHLERMFKRLDADYEKAVRSLAEKIRLVRNDIASERSAREQSIATVTGKLEGATANNLWLELTGVVFFVIGVAMTSASHEIDGLLQY